MCSWNYFLRELMSMGSAARIFILSYLIPFIIKLLSVKAKLTSDGQILNSLPFKVIVKGSTVTIRNPNALYSFMINSSKE